MLKMPPRFLIKRGGIFFYCLTSNHLGYNTMVGYHAIPVIADAYLKGFRGFDAEKAFEAMKSFALSDERGLDYVKSQGFIPAESQVESVARAMEYVIDDWCIAAMANALGKTEDAELFLKRAKYYEFYFDNDIRFMRSKKDGIFVFNNSKRYHPFFDDADSIRV